MLYMTSLQTEKIISKYKEMFYVVLMLRYIFMLQGKLKLMIWIYDFIGELAIVSKTGAYLNIDYRENYFEIGYLREECEDVQLVFTAPLSVIDRDMVRKIIRFLKTSIWNV